MGRLRVSSAVLEKYYAFLTRFDTQTKKELIIKLTDSIEIPSNRDFDLKDLFGAWEDHRSSDEIIDEIRESRVDKKDVESF